MKYRFRQWSSADRMQLTFPINGEYSKHAYELLQNKRLASSIEQFPVSFEMINSTNFNAYMDLLHNQYQNSDKTMRDYIARIVFTEQSQQFSRSLSTGWHNSFSITLIAHKKVDQHHKILIAKLSKEITISWLRRIMSPLTFLFGMTFGEQKDIEAILTNLNQEGNKETMENLMMFMMAENLRTRLSNHVDINFIGSKNIEL